MLVKYKGSQSAMTMSVGGVSVRLLPETPVLLTKAQADELQARANTKRLVKAKVVEFNSLDTLNKDELVALASTNGFEVTGKEKVKDLIDLMSGDDDTDDDTGDETGTGDDTNPAE